MNWSGVWLRLMWRLSVVFALAAIVSASAPDCAQAQPKAKGPLRSPEEFIERERAKILEKKDREGPRFDAERELQKLQERHQKDFGEPLPKSRLRDIQKVLVDSGPQAADSRTVKSSSSPVARTGNVSAANGSLRCEPRYQDGLPDWFRERDLDHDAQVGMYEWPRNELADYWAWDLNGDGLVEQAEALRRLRQLNGTKSVGRSSTMSTTRGSTLRSTNATRSAASPQPMPDPQPKPPPKPGKPTTPDEFLSKEATKLAAKAAREGDRFDPEREFEKLRDKYRKDLGEELPLDVENELRFAMRRAQKENP